MKALASLIVAALVASAPAAAGPRVGFASPHGARERNMAGLGYGEGHHGGSGFHDHSFHDHNFHDHGFHDNGFRGQFVGASWIEPGFYANAPIDNVQPQPEPYFVPVPVPVNVAPISSVAPIRNPGPRIIYLNGKPAKTGKEPVVVYGTYN